MRWGRRYPTFTLTLTTHHAIFTAHHSTFTLSLALALALSLATTPTRSGRRCRHAAP